MYFCEETGEFIHPIFFDSHEEAREVRANSTDVEVCDAEAACALFECGLGITVNGDVTRRLTVRSRAQQVQRGQNRLKPGW